MGTVQVEAARIPDRNRMVEILRENGLDARPVDETEIEVPCADAAEACEDLYGRVEGLVMQLGAPFVPVKHDGTIYLRPPVS